MSYLPTGAGTYLLNSSIGSSDVTILLSSFLEPISLTAYTMANIGTDIVYATIAPKTANSEFISFTGITQNGDGTALLTGVTRGLSRSTPFTSSVTFKLPHAGQSQLILSNSPQQINEYATLRNAQTFSGQITFTLPPIGINPGGAADASYTVKGITKLSEVPVSATNPIAVGTNDTRVPPVNTSTLTANMVAALAGTGTPNGTTGKYVTRDTLTSEEAAFEVLTNKDTTTTLGTSDTKYPSQKAVKTYVDNLKLGAWGSATADNAAHQVSTDGFLVGYGQVSTANEIIVRTDSSNPPTTIRADLATGNAVQYYPGFFCIPIKKNDYYKITGTVVAVYFIPFGT